MNDLLYILDSRGLASASVLQSIYSLEQQGVAPEQLRILDGTQLLESKDFLGDVIVMRAGVELLPHAVNRLTDVFAEHSEEKALFYSDAVFIVQDDVGVKLEKQHRITRPDWSPTRLIGQDYLGPLIALRMPQVNSMMTEAANAGRWREFLLFSANNASVVKHIDEILYCQPKEEMVLNQTAELETLAQIQRYLDKRSPGSVVNRGSVPNIATVQRPFLSSSRISIVIPTRGTSGSVFGVDQVFVVEAVRSVITKTHHQDIEFVIVYDTGTPQGVLDTIDEVSSGRAIFVEYTKPFNFSEKCNVGFLESTGDIVVMLNDDIRVISDDFLDILVAPLADTLIGMTGAFLVFEDGSIQHVGHWYSGRSPRHAMITQGADQAGPNDVLTFDREVFGLTAACVALRRETYVQAGGFSETLPSNYNDVDFSRKIGMLGLRLIWLHNVKAYHFESKTRVGTVHEWERSIVHGRWGIPERDPFWIHTS